jgi:hypothetical protein
MGGKGDVEYTLGYRYYASIHMLLCEGAATIRKVFVGDKEVALLGYGERRSVDAPALFGGEDGEGGVQGGVAIFTNGMAADWRNYQYSLIGRPIPAYKGVTNVCLGGRFMLCAVNPYPKPWRFCVHRSPIVPSMSNVNVTDKTVNPAAIIAECLINQDWGLGVETGDVDFAAFNAAASTLNGEGFGLAIRWDQQNSIEEFISEICQIIDAQLSMDPVSGKFALKLIRNDYNYDNLLSLGESDILELSDFSRPDPKDLINQVVVVFEDCDTGVQQSIAEQNTASLMLNPAVNSVQLNYPGIPTQALARKVALRELAQYSSGLARCTITANRKAATLKMGDCFKLSWPALGFDGLVMRVTNFQQGNPKDWRVRLECVQDIYGLPDTEFVEEETGWTGPDFTPVPLTQAVAYELPYYLISWLVTGDKDSAWADLPEGFGYGAIAAVQPMGMALSFQVYIQDYSYNNAWKPNRKLSFTEHSFLTDDIDDTATQFTVSGGYYYKIETSEPLLIDGEWMVVTAFNANTGLVTVGRGCMDSVPAPHSKDAIVWFIGMYNNVVNKEYINGQTMSAILSTVTPAGSTALASSPTYTCQMKNRAARPLAPANIRINGTYRPKTLTSWAANMQFSTRDRHDTARLLDDKQGAAIPDEGTSYTVQIREMLFSNSPWFSVSTTTGITESPFTLTGKYTPQAYSLEISAWAVLDGLESWQKSVVTLTHDALIPVAISMTIANPPTSGRSNGDLYVNPADAGTNPGWYKTWRNGAFVTTQPLTGQKVSVSGIIYEYDNGWSVTP